MHTTNGAAEGDFDESTDKAEIQSFEEQVNAATSKMTQDEKGLWQVPKDLPEEVAYAAKLEKRRRDLQSAHAKTSQELDATKAQISKLQTKLKESFTPKLSTDQTEELEDLASSDPEAYRKKMNEYEGAASKAFDDELASLGYDEDQITELATRSQLLTDFLEDNPGLVLNDDVMENDLPPRLKHKLEKGEYTFSQFLEESKKFLTAGKKVAGSEKEVEEPDLSKAGGGSSASKAAVRGDIEESYINEVY